MYVKGKDNPNMKQMKDHHKRPRKVAWLLLFQKHKRIPYICLQQPKDTSRYEEALNVKLLLPEMCKVSSANLPESSKVFSLRHGVSFIHVCLVLFQMCMISAVSFIYVKCFFYMNLFCSFTNCWIIAVSYMFIYCYFT